jgi:ankyrin repeat protein
MPVRSKYHADFFILKGQTNEYLLIYFHFWNCRAHIEGLVGPILDAGFDVNAILPNNRLLLASLVSEHTNAANLVKEFLRRPNFDSAKRDRDGFTYLHYFSCHAADDESLWSPDIMGRFCGDINERINGFTALELACEGGAPAVEYLLEHGADPNLCNDGGTCTLSQVLDNKTDAAEVMRLLLKHKLDLNVGLGEFPSALHLVASCRSPEVTQVLLDYGIDKDAVDDEGRSAFDFAFDGLADDDGDQKELSLELLDMLLPSKVPDTALMRVHVCFSPEFIQKMVDRGADPRFLHPKSGKTVIHKAIRAQLSVECLKMLFELGAVCNTDSRLTKKNWKGATVLHYACEYVGVEKAVEIIRLLVAQGVPIDARDSDGYTALALYALFAGRKEQGVPIPETLVALGADETVLPDGYSSLLECCTRFLAQDFMIKWCIGLESSRRLGFSAEDVPEDSDVLKFILTDPRFAPWLASACPLPNRKKSTVLDAMLLEAAAMGDADRFELILSRGGSLQARTDHGNTSLLLACTLKTVDVSFLALLVDKYGYSVHDKHTVSGGSLLHRAACQSTADFLISRGVDESIKNNKSKLWHEVAKWKVSMTNEKCVQ